MSSFSFPANALTISPEQWLNRLRDYLPSAYIAANKPALLALRGQGCSAHCASIYAQAYGLPARAPRMDTD